MKIVGVCACTVGIAHTYLAQEKLKKAAKKLGYNLQLETQGSVGVQDPLTQKDIDEADIAMLAVDIKFKGEDRFKNITKITVPTDVAIKSPTKLLQKVVEVAKSRAKKKA